MEPNVLIIVVDALRADRVGSLGGQELTPNIDRFAGESAVFENAYSTTNVTDPGITSIQTGRYPLSNGVVNHGTRVTDREKKIVENVPQLPGVLSQSGYRTAKFGRPLGRWHRKGFDRYPSSMENRAAFDKEGGNADVKQQIVGTLEKVHPKLRTVASSAYDSLQLCRAALNPPTREEVVAQYRDHPDEVVQNVGEFVRGSEPFYSFVHLMDTHTPYTADPETVRSLLEEFEYPTDVSMRGTGRHPRSFDRLVLSGEYPEIREKYYLPDGTPTTAITDAYYDAAVMGADERVGQILRHLRENDVYDDTLIVFLSDHGESLTEHGIYHDHHGLYDTTVRVPLVVRPPGGANETVTELVQITDIAPTVESYVGSNEIDADGFSLRPVIRGESSIDRRYILAEEAHTQRRRMVRTDSSKLIYLVDGDTVCRYCGVQHASEIEFYDLQRDPTEQKNLAGENEESVRELREHGDANAEEFENKRSEANGDERVIYEDEEEVEERLEALGYR